MTDWISGEEEMLHNFDKIDSDSHGKATPYVKDTIKLLMGMDFDAADIASYLCLDLPQVEAVLAKSSDGS